MKAKRKTACFLVLLAIPLLLGATAGGWLLLRRAVQRQAAAIAPPTVLVLSPGDGETTSAGGQLRVLVSASADIPLDRLELWLDGSIVETISPETPDQTYLSATSSLTLQEGAHLFFARAVDQRGLVGQSAPIALHGQPPPELTQITTQEGQSLEDIASAIGVPAEELGELNPTLVGAGGLSAGTPVTVPATGGQPGNGAAAGGGQPPSGQAGGGQPGGGGTQGAGGAQPGGVVLPPSPLPPAPPNTPPLQPITPVTVDWGAVFSLVSRFPKAPSGLQAGYENCKIRLTWIDNADNERHFRVWMQPFAGPPRVIATLTGSPQTGPAWFEFDSPATGIYAFWIEAVNNLGAQPSEIAWVFVHDLECAPGVAADLTLEALDMFVSGPYDRTYCYLSIEGHPERRIPSDDSTFLPLLGGWADLSNWTGNGNHLIIPEPMDGEVTLEGTCLAWQGNSGPDNLGSFSAHASKETWDGRRMELKGPAFVIGYRIQPRGPAQAKGFFGYTDPTLPPPSQPWAETRSAQDPRVAGAFVQRPMVNWTWTGNHRRLTGFTVLLDGKPIRFEPYVQKPWSGATVSTHWQTSVTLPSACGARYRLQVVANAGNAQSPPSPPLHLTMPPCEVYVEVTFETFEFTDVDDGEWGDCDTAEMYFHLAVYTSSGLGSMETGEYSTIDTGCGRHDFRDYVWAARRTTRYWASWAGPREPGPTVSEAAIIMPLAPKDPGFFVMAELYDDDSDFIDMDDGLCRVTQEVELPYEDWPSYSHRFTLPCKPVFYPRGQDAEGTVTISVRGFWGPGAGP